MRFGVGIRFGVVFWLQSSEDLEDLRCVISNICGWVCIVVTDCVLYALHVDLHTVTAAEGMHGGGWHCTKKTRNNTTQQIKTKNKKHLNDFLTPASW